MSEEKHIPRAVKRKSQKHYSKLLDILSSFYNRIGHNQLTDEEIRDTFTTHHQAWKKYCTNKELDDEAKQLFALEIKKTWERKKEKSEQ